MMNVELIISFESNIAWNLTKSHVLRLKSTEYNTHAIKQYLLKSESCNQINLKAYHKVLRYSFVITKFQRFSKFQSSSKYSLLLFKGESPLVVRRHSIKVNLKSLLVMIKRGKSSKTSK